MKNDKYLFSASTHLNTHLIASDASYKYAAGLLQIFSYVLSICECVTKEQ